MSLLPQAGASAAINKCEVAAGCSSATSSNPLGLKEIIIQYGDDHCKMMLVEGGDSAALVYSVDSYFGLGGLPFHLTVPETTAVIPLCAALPHGLILQLHLGGNRHFVGFPSTPVSCKAPQANLPPRGPVPKVTVGSPVVDRYPQASSVAVTVNCDQVLQSTQLETDSKATMAVHLAAVEHAANRIDRFSRLSTDLSNERTLLAWIRTVMAAMRTAFAYIGLVADAPFWLGTIWVGRLSMISLVLIGAFSGIRRYVVIKEATFQPVPPQKFGRLSIHYFSYVLVLSCIALVVGLAADSWDKA